MTYEPPKLRCINGTRAPRHAAHSWPIELDMSARTFGKVLRDGPCQSPTLWRLGVVVAKMMAPGALTAPHRPPR
jgi:hypothetical protein